jgi:hypothetical protein
MKMPNVLIHGLLLFALIAGPLPSLAQVDLFASAVPVTGEDAEERNRAITAALRRVLVKLTGSRHIDSRQGMGEIMAAAPDLVQQYRYQVDPQAGTDLPVRTLLVRFEPGALVGVLNERGWPVWQPPRPRLLVWLATESVGQRSLLNPDVSPGVGQALLDRASARGVPLQWPLLDLQDQARLSASDLWSGFEPNIREASQRYGEGPVLVGRLRSLPGGSWRPEWTLYDRSGAQAFRGSPAATLGEALGEGVDVASDLLAGRYGPASTASGSASVRVEIQGILRLADYASALKLVGQAPGVSRLSLRAAADDLVSFDVWLDGDASDLAVGLGMDGRLRRTVSAASGLDRDRLLYYWVP